MSGITWTKFFWSDWQSEPALRLCSYAARGLWMDMLCIAAAHDPIGYVAVAGRGLDETSIARMTGGQESEVRDLLGELERNGVFSRDRQSRIYSRRMVADAKKAAIARKNGKLGGNPSLGKIETNSASDNQEDNTPDNTPLKTHKPRAISQEDLDANASSGAEAKPRQAETADLVEILWSLQPVTGGKRKATRPDVAKALAAALKRGGQAADIEASFRAYYALPDCRRDEGKFAKGAAVLLNEDRWKDFLPSQSVLMLPQVDPWEFRIRRFVSGSRYWNDADDGPRPGQPGCQAPPEILAKFGFGGSPEGAPFAPRRAEA